MGNFLERGITLMIPTEQGNGQVEVNQIRDKIALYLFHPNNIALCPPSQTN